MNNFWKILAVIVTAAAAAAAIVLLIDSIRQKKLTSSDYDYDELDDLDDGLDEDDLSFLDSYEDEPEDASL